MGQLRDLLTSHPHTAFFAVADAAILDGLLEPMYALGRRRFACLLPGAVEADVAHVAPYLIALTQDAPLIEWLETRLALPWGYTIESALPLRRLHLHLRRFTETRGPRGEPLLFRFWDPRVLRSMAGILTREQLDTFMQGVSRIHLLHAGQAVSVEWDAGSGLLRFSDEPRVTIQGVADHAGV